ncbi:MAG TPA: hypothetical protein VFO99_19305 [Pyrinomonadaceae bacterium]|nr:hypothetical protein [Pyrinomonadaceae bacterium]
MKARPLSVTIISWLFMVFGSVALLSGLLPLTGANTAQLIAEFKTHWMVHLSRLLQIAGGLFMLHGHNWARWLIVAWIVFHIVIGALHGWLQLLIHVVIFSVILFFLFRRNASEYFRPESLPNSHQSLNRLD